MVTPFSGLLMIVHVVIVALGKLAGLFVAKKDTSHLKRKAKVKESATLRLVKSTLSILLIVSISLYMFISLMLVVYVGMREGADEHYFEDTYRVMEQLQAEAIYTYTSTINNVN
jgi:hypothetical protein